MEVLLRAKRGRERDPTHGVGCLAGHDAEEGLVALREPLEVKIHLLQSVDEDDVESTPIVDEGLSEQGALNDGLDDQRVRIEIRDVDPLIGSEEGNGLF
jgi:hypothetical protein